MTLHDGNVMHGLEEKGVSFLASLPVISVSGSFSLGRLSFWKERREEMLHEDFFEY